MDLYTEYVLCVQYLYQQRKRRLIVARSRDGLAESGDDPVDGLTSQRTIDDLGLIARQVSQLPALADLHPRRQLFAVNLLQLATAPDAFFEDWPEF